VSLHEVSADRHHFGVKVLLMYKTYQCGSPARQHLEHEVVRKDRRHSWSCSKSVMHPNVLDWLTSAKPWPDVLECGAKIRTWYSRLARSCFRSISALPILKASDIR
jgi:hypothetical protein